MLIRLTVVAITWNVSRIPFSPQQSAVTLRSHLENEASRSGDQLPQICPFMEKLLNFFPHVGTHVGKLALRPELIPDLIRSERWSTVRAEKPFADTAKSRNGGWSPRERDGE